MIHLNLKQITKIFNKISINDNGCWVSKIKQKSNRLTYPSFTLNGTRWLLYRLTYTWLVANLPETRRKYLRKDDIVPDHTCENIHCINPCHIELVTMSENARRSAVSRIYGKDRRLCRSYRSSKTW